MRTVGVVTVARSDYGIYRPVLRRMATEEQLELTLFVSGMHLSPRFGMTVDAIEADGFAIAARVDMLDESDSPTAIGRSMARGIAGFADAFARSRPDLLVVLGDRFEMYCAALAALPFAIPLAHIHGGELSEGAIDDALRHSMTKLSHLHFVATDDARRRVIQMGEEPWRVTVSGAPSLDNLQSYKRFTESDLERCYGVSVGKSTLLVTFHPTTLEYQDAARQTNELLAALKSNGSPVLFTMPNADTGGSAIREGIERFLRTEQLAQAVENLGTDAYFSVLSVCAAMVGNSSSGLIEAPAFGLPVVNIGNRQRGRLKGRNVIDVDTGREEVLRGLTQALDPAFRASLRGMPNPYGDGHAAERIVSRLRSEPLKQQLVMKSFQNTGYGAASYLG